MRYNGDHLRQEGNFGWPEDDDKDEQPEEKSTLWEAGYGSAARERERLERSRRKAEERVELTIAYENSELYSERHKAGRALRLPYGELESQVGIWLEELKQQVTEGDEEASEKATSELRYFYSNALGVDNRVRAGMTLGYSLPRIFLHDILNMFWRS